MSGVMPTPPCELMECKKARNNNVAYKRMLAEKDAAHAANILEAKKPLEEDIKRKRWLLEQAREGKFGVDKEESEQKKFLKEQLDAALVLNVACKKHHTGITPGMVAELVNTKKELAERIVEVTDLKYLQGLQIRTLKERGTIIDDLGTKVERLEKEQADLYNSANNYIANLVESHRLEVENVQGQLEEALNRFKSSEDTLKTVRDELKTVEERVKSVEEELEQKKIEFDASEAREKELLQSKAASQPATPEIPAIDTKVASPIPIAPSVVQVGSSPSVPKIILTPSESFDTKINNESLSNTAEDASQYISNLENKIMKMASSIKHYQKENAIAYAKKKEYAHAIFTGQETPPLAYGKSEYHGSALALCGKTDWLRMQIFNHKSPRVEELISLASPAPTKGRRQRGGKRGKGGMGKREEVAEEESKKKAGEERYGELNEESQDEKKTFSGMKQRRSIFEGHKSTFSNTIDDEKLAERRRRDMARRVEALLMRPCSSLPNMSSVSRNSGSSNTCNIAATTPLTPINTTSNTTPAITVSTPTLSSDSWSFSSIVGYLTGFW